MLLCAEKVLHTPLAAYLYRKTEDSLTRKNRTPLQNVNVFANVIFRGLKWIDNIMARLQFFETNPKYRYEILSHFTRKYFTMLYKNCPDVSPSEAYHSIKDEYGKNFGDYDVLFSTFFTLISGYRKKIEENKIQIAELEKQLT